MQRMFTTCLHFMSSGRHVPINAVGGVSTWRGGEVMKDAADAIARLVALSDDEHAALQQLPALHARKRKARAGKVAGKVLVKQQRGVHKLLKAPRKELQMQMHM